MQKIVPFLWFSDNAEEAVNYYVSVFQNSKITDVSRYGPAGPLPEGTVMVVEFELEGQEFMAINGGETGTAAAGVYPGAIALYVNCETQAEVDRLWDRLSDGGKKIQCGWLTDKYGFSWNIVPVGLASYIAGDDAEKSGRAMKAMLQMQKLDIDELRRAYEGVG
ncbi:MAG TPA: VOC family protein [Candidatus Baltobacteraceae bacterium]|jgi:predicted 3-demethylubiquinone-9 3-methyltransferase (glyoxalase superfamily)|nr:VOC family protein [Candidatus Baltobacteraceae bacterium]